MEIPAFSYEQVYYLTRTGLARELLPCPPGRPQSASVSSFIELNTQRHHALDNLDPLFVQDAGEDEHSAAS